MLGRGPQTFKKRQKEQQRKERQQGKMAKRLARKVESPRSATGNQEMAVASTAQDVRQKRPKQAQTFAKGTYRAVACTPSVA